MEATRGLQIRSSSRASGPAYSRGICTKAGGCNSCAAPTGRIAASPADCTALATETSGPKGEATGPAQDSHESITFEHRFGFNALWSIIALLSGGELCAPPSPFSCSQLTPSGWHGRVTLSDEFPSPPSRRGNREHRTGACALGSQKLLNCVPQKRLPLASQPTTAQASPAPHLSQLDSGCNVRRITKKKSGPISCAACLMLFCLNLNSFSPPQGNLATNPADKLIRHAYGLQF